MKRISLGSLILLALLLNSAGANTFDQISIRGAARELGIGFGQGYHSKPMPVQLRPHYERVTNCQMWKVCPPPAYPATPTAPIMMPQAQDWQSYSGDATRAQYIPEPAQTMRAKPERKNPDSGEVPRINNRPATRRPPVSKPPAERIELPPPAQGASHSQRDANSEFIPDNTLATGSKVRHFSSNGAVQTVDGCPGGPGCSESNTDALLRKLDQYETEMDKMGIDLKAEPMIPATIKPQLNPSAVRAVEPFRGPASLPEDEAISEVRPVPRTPSSTTPQNLKSGLPYSSTTPSMKERKPAADPKLPSALHNPNPRPSTTPVQSFAPRDQKLTPLPTTSQPLVNSRQAASGSSKAAVPGSWPATTSSQQAPDARRPPVPRSYGNPNVWW